MYPYRAAFVSASVSLRPIPFFKKRLSSVNPGEKETKEEPNLGDGDNFNFPRIHSETQFFRLLECEKEEKKSSEFGDRGSCAREIHTRKSNKVILQTACSTTLHQLHVDRMIIHDTR